MLNEMQFSEVLARAAARRIRGRAEAAAQDATTIPITRPVQRPLAGMADDPISEQLRQFIGSA